jgi:hypothetical protein
MERIWYFEDVVRPTAIPFIGPILRRIRVERGLTQSDMAALTGLRQNYIHYLERSARCPSLDTMERICYSLDISVASVIMEAEMLAASTTRPIPERELIVPVSRS